jgi:SAM-dependent methyltransferase
MSGVTGTLGKIAREMRMAEPGNLRLRIGKCPLCGWTAFTKWRANVMATRCISCRATPIAMGMGVVLAEMVPGFREKRVYELSSMGPFFRFLAREVRNLTYSEYFDDVPSGTFVGGIQCQDVQQLSFGDGSFDVCTNTEVFEHVPDDLRGFREIRRALAPGGVLLFTVPLHDTERTVERARMESGVLIHLLPPEYHEDNIRGRHKVLVYRDYGRDIVERLRAAGFHESGIVPVRDPSGMGHTPHVVVARKR